MAIAVFDLVALDCPDPQALAAFYQRILGGEIKQPDDDDDTWMVLELEDACDIGFQLDPDHQPPGWPDGSPQQSHLDLNVADLDEGEAAILPLGAVKTDTQPRPDAWRVYLDPAGHPFCLVTA